jgi:hypothetical protein
MTTFICYLLYPFIVWPHYLGQMCGISSCADPKKCKTCKKFKNKKQNFPLDWIKNNLFQFLSDDQSDCPTTKCPTTKCPTTKCPTTKTPTTQPTTQPTTEEPTTEEPTTEEPTTEEPTTEEPTTEEPTTEEPTTEEPTTEEPTTEEPTTEEPTTEEPTTEEPTTEEPTTEEPTTEEPTTEEPTTEEPTTEEPTTEEPTTEEPTTEEPTTEEPTTEEPTTEEPTTEEPTTEEPTTEEPTTEEPTTEEPTTEEPFVPITTAPGTTIFIPGDDCSDNQSPYYIAYGGYQEDTDHLIYTYTIIKNCSRDVSHTIFFANLYPENTEPVKPCVQINEQVTDYSKDGSFNIDNTVYLYGYKYEGWVESGNSKQYNVIVNKRFIEQAESDVDIYLKFGNFRRVVGTVGPMIKTDMSCTDGDY